MWPSCPQEEYSALPERKWVKSEGVRVWLCLCVCGSRPWMGEVWGSQTHPAMAKTVLRIVCAGLKGVQHLCSGFSGQGNSGGI